jgi:hypothetical protein
MSFHRNTFFGNETHKGQMYSTPNDPNTLRHPTGRIPWGIRKVLAQSQQVTIRVMLHLFSEGTYFPCDRNLS